MVLPFYFVFENETENIQGLTGDTTYQNLDNTTNSNTITPITVDPSTINYTVAKKTLLGYFTNEKDAKLYTSVNNTFFGKNQSYTNDIESLDTIDFDTNYTKKYEDYQLYKYQFTTSLDMKDSLYNSFSVDDFKKVTKSEYNLNKDYIIANPDDPYPTANIDLKREDDNTLILNYIFYSKDDDEKTASKAYFAVIDNIVDKIYIINKGSDYFTYSDIKNALADIARDVANIDYLKTLVNKYPDNAKHYVDELPNTDVIEVDDSEVKVVAGSIDEIQDLIDTTAATKMNIKISRDLVTDKTINIPEGKIITLDLTNRSISSTNDTISVGSNSTLTVKNGTISTTNDNCSAIVVDNANLNMEATIDNRTADNDTHNKAAGIYTKNDSKININGYIYTDEQSAIVTENTLGYAVININNNAIISTSNNAAIYMANADIVNINNNATVYGGIIARMGNVNVNDRAKVINNGLATDAYYNAGALAMEDSARPIKDAIIAYIGQFDTEKTQNRLIANMDEEKTNAFTLTVNETASIVSKDGVGVAVAMVDTKAPTSALISLRSDKITTKVYTHDELTEMAKQDSKILPKSIGVSHVQFVVNGSDIYNNKEDTEVIPPEDGTSDEDTTPTDGDTSTDTTTTTDETSKDESGSTTDIEETTDDTTPTDKSTEDESKSTDTTGDTSSEDTSSTKDNTSTDTTTDETTTDDKKSDDTGTDESDSTNG